MKVNWKPILAALVVVGLAAVSFGLAARPAAAASNQFVVPGDCPVKYNADWEHPGGDPVWQGGVYSPSGLQTVLSSHAGRRAMHCAGLSNTEQLALIQAAPSAKLRLIPQGYHYAVMVGGHETFTNGSLTGGSLAAWLVTATLPNGGTISAYFAEICVNVVPIARTTPTPHKAPPSKPAPKVQYTYVQAWKYFQLNGKLVNGRKWQVYAAGNRSKQWPIISGKWVKLGPFKVGHVPQKFCEIIYAPVKSQTGACQMVKLYYGKKVVIFSNYAVSTPVPTPPTPLPAPPQPPVITITQICSNGQIIVVVGNGNSNIGNGNVATGNNCNSSPQPPVPTSTPTPTPTPTPQHTCVASHGNVGKDGQTVTFSVACNGPIASAVWTFSGNSAQATGTTVTNQFPDNQMGGTATAYVTVVFSDGAPNWTGSSSVTLPPPSSGSINPPPPPGSTGSQPTGSDPQAGTSGSTVPTDSSGNVLPPP